MRHAEVRLEAVSEPGWLKAFILEHWGGPGVVSRGRVWCDEGLTAIRAMDKEGLAGVVSWHAGPEEWEVVTINSRQSGQGVGTRLMDAVVELARRAGVRRLWLVTTNDNTPAMRFYEQRGFRQSAVYRDAIDVSRALKPGIPAIGLNGVPIRDEVEYELVLAGRSRAN